MKTEKPTTHAGALDGASSRGAIPHVPTALDIGSGTFAAAAFPLSRQSTYRDIGIGCEQLLAKLARSSSWVRTKKSARHYEEPLRALAALLKDFQIEPVNASKQAALLRAVQNVVDAIDTAKHHKILADGDRHSDKFKLLSNGRAMFNALYQQLETHFSATRTAEPAHADTLVGTRPASTSLPSRHASPQMAVPSAHARTQPAAVYHQPPPPMPDVAHTELAVIGGGLGGLMAAAKAGERGITVTLIEKRETADRGNRILLDPHIFHELDRMAARLIAHHKALHPDARDDDVTFHVAFGKKKLGKAKPVAEFLKSSPHGHHRRGNIAIKDLQAFMEHYIATLCPDVTILRDSVTGMDKQSGTITLKETGEVLQCGQLLIADGAQRSTLKMLQPGLKERDLADHATLAYQGAAAAHLQVVTPQGPVSDMQSFGRGTLLSTRPRKYAQALKAMGWTSPYLPTAMMVCGDASAPKKKMYVTCEIPLSIATNANKEEKRRQIEAWTTLLTRMLIWSDDFDAPTHRDHVRVRARGHAASSGSGAATDGEKEGRITRKAALDLQAWKMTLTSIRVDDAVMVLDPEAPTRMAVSIGDAFQSAFFPEGHGGNDAMSEAIAYVRCLSRTESGAMVVNDVQMKELLNETRGVLVSKLVRNQYVTPNPGERGL